MQSERYDMCSAFILLSTRIQQVEEERRGEEGAVTQFQETSATGHCSIWPELVISILGPLVPAWFLIMTQAEHTKATALQFTTSAGL